MVIKESSPCHKCDQNGNVIDDSEDFKNGVAVYIKGHVDEQIIEGETYEVQCIGL